MRNKESCLAEVIESSLNGWKAQAWDWNVVPSFGSLVSVQSGNREIFGIVHQINSGSFDVGRAPFAYQQTHEELLAQQPQIFEFIKTYFSCLTLGYREDGVMCYTLAPEPPQIHAFVGKVTGRSLGSFFGDTGYLDVLFGHEQQIENIDELLLALIRNISAQGLVQGPAITEFVQAFSLLTGNDYRRLKLFLRRVQPFIDAQVA